MSIIIKDMKMPASCLECTFITDYYDGGPDVCCLLDKYTKRTTSILEDCPLVEIPPHGRLIDADVAEVISFSDEDAKGDFCDGILFAADWISEQPTIIEAEEGET